MSAELNSSSSANKQASQSRSLGEKQQQPASTTGSATTSTTTSISASASPSTAPATSGHSQQLHSSSVVAPLTRTVPPVPTKSAYAIPALEPNTSAAQAKPSAQHTSSTISAQKGMPLQTSHDMDTTNDEPVALLPRAHVSRSASTVHSTSAHYVSSTRETASTAPRSSPSTKERSEIQRPAEPIPPPAPSPSSLPSNALPARTTSIQPATTTPTSKPTRTRFAPLDEAAKPTPGKQGSVSGTQAGQITETNPRPHDQPIQSLSSSSTSRVSSHQITHGEIQTRSKSQTQITAKSNTPIETTRSQDPAKSSQQSQSAALTNRPSATPTASTSDIQGSSS